MVIWCLLVDSRIVLHLTPAHQPYQNSNKHSAPLSRRFLFGNLGSPDVGFQHPFDGPSLAPRERDLIDEVQGGRVGSFL